MSADRWDDTSQALLRAENEELALVLDELRTAVCADRRDRRQLLARVTRLHELVERHFCHEERDGYLKDALERAPYLSGEAAALQEQHEVLLEQLEKLCLLVRAGVEMPTWWSRIEADFKGFAAQLLAHEHAEARMVERAYTANMTPGD